MKNIKEFFSNIFNKDSFIKILAILIAIGIWLYIVNVADSVSSKTYSNIPITFAYEGTIPYNNGLLPLVTSRVYNATIQVKGSRTELMYFDPDELQVYFDFSAIEEAGTYKVPLIVTSLNPDITAEIVGENNVLMEFTEGASVNLNVTYRKSGNYASGYEEISKSIAPKTVTVRGPKDVVETIKYAEVQIPAENASSSIFQNADIVLLTEDRSYVDRTFLSMSSTTANVSVELAYRKSLKLEVNLINRYGGNESLYTTVTFSHPYILVQGEQSILDSIDTLNLGDVYLDEIKMGKKTYEKTLYLPEGLTSVDNLNHISFTVDTGEAEIQNTKISYTALKNTDIRNVPEGKTAKVKTLYTYITMRALPYVFKDFDATQWSYYVDLNETTNDNGHYLLHVEIPQDVPAGLVANTYVEIELTDAE